jgi:hypothetical protein
MMRRVYMGWWSVAGKLKLQVVVSVVVEFEVGFSAG